MEASGTQYPVTIDPDVFDVANDGDTYVDTLNPDTNYSSDYSTYSSIYYHFSTLEKEFGFERFKVGPLVGKDVLSATLNMYQYYTDNYSGCSASAHTTDIYAIDGPRFYDNWTWNRRPFVASGSVWTNSVSSANGGGTSCPAGNVAMDVTRQINGYTTGELPSVSWSGDTADNKPYIATIELQPENQSTPNTVAFCSDNSGAAPAGSPCTNSANAPTLDLTYRPLLGMDTATSTFDHRLNDAAGLHVNNDTGNAMIKSQDLHLAGIGQDLTINRWYNAAANQTGGVGTTSLGTAGWSLSLGPDVYMERASNGTTSYPNRYDFHAAGGAVYGHFARMATSSSNSDYYKFYEPTYGGVDATLKDDNPASGPDTFTLTMHASQMKYHFKQVDSSSNNLYLSSTEDRLGNTITYNYVSGTHKLSSIVDTDGRSVSVAYNSAGYIHTITDSFGPATRTWTYDYDSAGHGNLVDYIDPTGAETDYDYTLIAGQYRLTTVTDPAQSNGKRPTTVLTYDSTTGVFDEVQYQTGVDGGGSPLYATFTWNYSNSKAATCNKGNRSTVLSDLSDTPSSSTTYCFQDLIDGQDGDQGTTEIIDGIGNRRGGSYSPDRKPVSLTSPEDDGISGGSTVATYGTALTDQLQSVTEPKDPGDTSASSKYTYSASSSIPGYQYLPTSVKDTNGNCTRYDYVTSGNGVGLVKTATIGLTPTAGDCSSATGSQQWHNDYNSHGQVIDTWDANGNGTTAADQTVYTYNTDGEVQTIARPGGSCTTPRKLCTSYTYDGDGRVSTMTDGRGKQTTYSYDKDDRVTQVLFDGASSCTLTAGTCIQYTYDGEGNLAIRTDVSGTTTFGYDMLNQQSSQSLPDGSSVATAYDAAGNLLQYDQTAHTNSGTVSDSETYTHNAANQTISAKNNNTGGSADVITLQPNKNGNRKLVTYPTTSGIGGYTTLYTNAGHVKSITPSGTAMPTYTYSWKQGGQETDEVQSVTTTNGQSSQDGTITYTYNHSNQLTASNDSSTQPDYGFTYDNAGNMQSKTVGASTTQFGYTEAGILCWKGSTNGTHVAQSCPSTPSGDTTVNHDDNGNNTGTASAANGYDAANRASSLAGVPQTYLDQGNNLRSGDGSGGSAMTFINGPLGVTARIAGSTVTFYVRNTDGSLLEERGASGTRYYVLGTHQSVTGLIDSNGAAFASYLYGPYGETAANAESGGGTAADNPWRWDGGYQDAVEGDNLYHFGARYYDPTTTRWTQPDPQPGSIGNPLSLSPFAFGSDDPINHRDVSGMFSVPEFALGLFDVVAGLGTIGLGIYIGVLTSWTVVGIFAGGFVALNGLAEVGAGVVEIIHSFD